MSSTRIIELASIIQRNTKTIDEHLTSKGLPTPSFEADNPPTTLFRQGPEIDAARQAVVDATDELQALMLGPTGMLTSFFHNSLLSVHAILRLNLDEFPAGKEETTFEELAQKCGLNESEVKRLLRHAMAFRIFTEPRKGVVAHTAASKRLADPLIKAWIGMATEELWPCAVKTVDTLLKWPEASEPTQTPFNMANNTENMFFDEIAKFPKRQARYEDAMAWSNSGPGLEPTGLVDCVPWNEYETVVDVGGNTGLVSQAIARKHKSVKFIVQDRPEPVSEGNARLPEEFKDQISFMEHDFFTDQPVCADAYLMRWILHDWSDKYAIKILKALIPSLKQGARIVLNELVPPPPGVGSPYGNKVIRTMDLTMLELHNGKERDNDDWRNLFEECDPRFKYLGVMRPPSSRLAIVQAKWEP